MKNIRFTGRIWMCYPLYEVQSISFGGGCTYLWVGLLSMNCMFSKNWQKLQFSISLLVQVCFGFWLFCTNVKSVTGYIMWLTSLKKFWPIQYDQLWACLFVYGSDLAHIYIYIVCVWTWLRGMNDLWTVWFYGVVTGRSWCLNCGGITTVIFLPKRLV